MSVPISSIGGAASVQTVGGEPLVSVVIPTHNRAPLLRRALQSVCAQTYANLEIIVVDDASTDDTRAVVACFGDARIRYLRNEENKGGAGTRNVGVRAACGEYIAFLDDDDEWEPDKTAEQVKLLQRYHVTLCGYHGEDRGVARRYQARATVNLDELRRGFIRGGGTSALMARADVLKQTLFDETLPRCQDWDLCIRLAHQHDIGYARRPLVRYNDGDHPRISNKTRYFSVTAIEGELRMLEKHKAFLGPWFNFHMCRFLLRDLKRGPDKVSRVVYACRRYGLASVGWALLDRVYIKAWEKVA